MDVKVVGQTASTLVKDGMVVGFGSGEFVYETIKALGVKVSCGEFNITAIPSNAKSAILLEQFHIPIKNMLDCDPDLMFEQAMELDTDYDFLKGKSESLLKDNLLCYSAKKCVVLLNKNGWRQNLTRKIVFEVHPFAIKRLSEQVGLMGRVSKISDSESEDGNKFVEIEFDKKFDHGDIVHKAFEIPGVIDTNYFQGMADVAIVFAYGDVHVQKKNDQFLRF
ncbi:MAG: ribose-5-phosphate isomerase A [Candidatus Diapherotrites archaeon]|nr:ribose-5-phosphate isomerase A [Candidatus Diapherotrites archaeon]